MSSEVTHGLMAVCFVAFVIAIGWGFVGLGVGLVFLTIPQAFGVGMLSSGVGILFGVFQTKQSAKRIVEAIKESKEVAK